MNQPTHSNQDNRRINLPLQTRMASLEDAVGMDSGADRTFNVVFTTGATVRRYDYMNDEAYDEELMVDTSAMRMDRLNSGAPVLDTHGQYTLDDVIGAVVPGSARIAKGVGRASIKIDGGEENAAVIRKINDGIIKNVSVGYRVHRFEVIRGEGTVPLYRAVDWEPYEISLVPIGADAGAGIRSAPHTYPCELFQPQAQTQSQPQRKETTMPDNVIDKDPPANAATANAAAASTTQTRSEPAKPEKTDPVTTVANDPADDAVSEDATREGGVMAERNRVQEIQKIVRAAGLTDAYALRMINDGVSLKKVRKSVLDELARANAEGGEVRSHVTITRDEMDRARPRHGGNVLSRAAGDHEKEAQYRSGIEQMGFGTGGTHSRQLAGH